MKNLKKVFLVIGWLGIGISTLSICFHIILGFSNEIFHYENWGKLGEVLISEYFFWWYLIFAVTAVFWYLGKDAKKG
ncbi:MAG: hypothetical protein GQ574_16460 [Crocinitomix sp.]|nr:hypothetical protein [Crocinitomix sp.]